MKRDLYAECNVDGAPPDLFAERCCNLCINLDCSRAKSTQGKFEARVQGWEDRLFLRVPRMGQDDPRFLPLAQQAFVDVPLARKTSVSVPSTWYDPRDLEAAQKTEPGARAPEPPTPVAERPQVAAVAPGTTEPKPMAENSSWSRGQTAASLNTPFQSGVMLGGATQTKNPTPAADPWAAPTPSPAQGTEHRIVPRGAKIKLSGG